MHEHPDRAVDRARDFFMPHFACTNAGGVLICLDQQRLSIVSKSILKHLDLFGRIVDDAIIFANDTCEIYMTGICSRSLLDPPWMSENAFYQ